MTNVLLYKPGETTRSVEHGQIVKYSVVKSKSTGKMYKCWCFYFI